jgi:acyl-coenzyme A thioesterase PaaI-like protein
LKEIHFAEQSVAKVNDRDKMTETTVSDTIRLEPNPDNVCFGCGGANDGGMKLTFEQDNAARKIVGRFVLGQRYQGGGKMAHGGIIALLLDEAMGKVCRFRDVRAVTAQLTVDYIKPIDVEKEIIVEAYEETLTGRNLFQVGEIRSAAGEVLAKGKGRFVIIGQTETNNLAI